MVTPYNGQVSFPPRQGRPKGDPHYEWLSKPQGFSCPPTRWVRAPPLGFGMGRGGREWKEDKISSYAWGGEGGKGPGRELLTPCVLATAIVTPKLREATPQHRIR